MTASELETELKASLDDAEGLELDFSRLDYISSSGLRLLLSAHKTVGKKGDVKVLNVYETVKEVLVVTGFAGILSIQ